METNTLFWCIKDHGISLLWIDMLSTRRPLCGVVESLYAFIMTMVGLIHHWRGASLLAAGRFLQHPTHQSYPFFLEWNRWEFVGCRFGSPNILCSTEWRNMIDMLSPLITTLLRRTIRREESQSTFHRWLFNTLFFASASFCSMVHLPSSNVDCQGLKIVGKLNISHKKYSCDKSLYKTRWGERPIEWISNNLRRYTRQ